MPRILRIINRLNLGGPTLNVAYLSKYLAPEYETLLLSGMKDASEESSEFILQSLGLEPVYIPEMCREPDFFKDRQAYLKIKQIIKDFKPDIVHTHAAKAGAIGRLAAASCRVPVVLHTFHGHVFHSYFSPAKTRLYVEIEKFLARKSTRIIAISDLQKEELWASYNICPADKIEVVRLGFDLARFQQDQAVKRSQFRTQYNLDADEIAVGIVGRLVPVKNHKFFLEVIKDVFVKTDRKVRAFIIGDGEERNQIEGLAKTLGLDFIDNTKENLKACLSFTSWIKEIDIAYAGLDIVALTSLNEGTPVSLIEAQAANKPIVATRVGGIEDIMLKNETGFLSEKGDKESFVKNLIFLIENKEIREKLGLNGWAHVQKTFHFERLVKDMDTLYRKLLNAKG